MFLNSIRIFLDPTEVEEFLPLLFSTDGGDQIMMEELEESPFVLNSVSLSVNEKATELRTKVASSFLNFFSTFSPLSCFPHLPPCPSLSLLFPFHIPSFQSFTFTNCFLLHLRLLFIIFFYYHSSSFQH